MVSTPSIRLNQGQRRDLAIICKIGPSRLRSAAEKVAGLGRTIKTHTIDAALASELGADDAESLARVLFGLATALRKRTTSVADVMQMIDDAIEAADDPRFATWPECKHEFEELLGLESVKLAAKAVDVSYDFERVYVAGRFLTTVRPIFTDDRAEVVGATIVQTLRVEFASANGDQRSLSLSLDTEDIMRLQEACEDALRKTEAARETMEIQFKQNIIIPGED